MKQIGKLKILSDFRPADRLSELEEVPKIGNRIDYWQAAKMLCEKDGGHLATREELAQIASEIYVNDDGSPVKIKKDDDTCDLRIKSRHKSNPPLVFGLSSYWSSEEYSATSAYYRYFGTSLTGGNDDAWDSKNYSSNRAICIVNIQDRLNLVNELEQECEELKKYIREREVWGDHCEFCKHNDKENCYQNIILDNLKTINRYRKALEEIKKACLEDTRTFADGTQVRHNVLDNILDIISKAKGGKNEGQI